MTTTYTFTAKDGNDVTVETVGSYYNRLAYDFAIEYNGSYTELDEVDSGNVDMIFEALKGFGFEPDSPSAFWFEWHYIAQVMIDETATMESLIALMDIMDPAKFDSFYENEWMD